ncbi:TonB-dependent receptor plug domain-containing protein [Puia sp. P3]|uniref:TonB-dependent receptor plug domain-containing protein n=1 Tax=Puia sp. P3 TaxID=3423952 RepID=UPI003D66D7C3
MTPRTSTKLVVTGFGTKTNLRKVPYSVTQIKGDEITRANNANFVDALQGKVAGVFIGQGAGGPSSSAKIRIRGNASLKPNTQPLVVIDGILIQPGNTGADSWGQNRDMGNIIKDLNPDDYESIDVLKGSAATALYGSKGLDGVLLITTKKVAPVKTSASASRIPSLSTMPTSCPTIRIPTAVVSNPLSIRTLRATTSSIR